MIGLSVAARRRCSRASCSRSATSSRASSRATPAVIAQCALLWPLFALMQPLNGAVFALDGILIGASDGRYLVWSMVAAFVVCAVALAVVVAGRLGRRGVWAALACSSASALALMGARFPRRRWLVTGFD